MKYGYAKHLRDALPNSNFIGFTGTPIDFEDKSTTAVFGNYIDTYDMTRAVEDGATVKIYYENRFVKLGLSEMNLDDADNEFEEIMENVEEYKSERKKREITNMEAVIGSPSRIRDIAKDIVSHWENRKSAAFGKGMIVCMSRRICVELYKAITELKPDWHHDDKAKGKIKVIMTNNASDPMEWKQHFTTKQDREELANRMKDEDDELEISIVRDMWLTGFDVPCMHTMYIDKSMAGHNLMQAIARVNRVFKDKDGGLVVDYIGIAENLKRALKQYSTSDRKTTGIDLDRAIQIMLEYYEMVKDLLHGYDYSGYKSKNPMTRAKSIMGGMNYILEKDIDKEGSKKEFLKQVIALAKAHALCVSTEEGQRLNEEVSYFKALKASINKLEKPATDKKPLSDEEINKRIAKLLGNTIISEEVIDVYKELDLRLRICLCCLMNS